MKDFKKEIEPNLIIQLDKDTIVGLMGNGIVANIKDDKIVNQYFSPAAHNLLIELIISNCENFTGLKYKTKNILKHKEK